MELTVIDVKFTFLLDRYRLQCDLFEGLWPIVNEHTKRLKAHYAKKKVNFVSLTFYRSISFVPHRVVHEHCHYLEVFTVSGKLESFCKELPFECQTCSKVLLRSGVIIL